LQTKKNRILVIDDDESVREVTAWMLRSRGLEVIEAESGEKGIDLARRANPDLILSDVLMPNMDGFEVLDRLQMDPETVGIPLIFITGWADPVEVSNQLKRGVRFIWKPFNIEMLMHSVLAHLTSPDAGRNSQLSVAATIPRGTSLLLCSSATTMPSA
jgi:CheY-like chemotaxis protein